MGFSAVDLSLPGGDDLATGFGKVNAGFVDTIQEIVRGRVAGWDVTNTYGAGPLDGQRILAQTVYASGANRVKAVFTYGTSGVENGLLVTTAYSVSINSGVDYTPAGSVTHVYAQSGPDQGLITSSPWSDPA